MKATIKDEDQVEYLLIVEGAPADVDAFVEQVQNPSTPEQRFVAARAVGVPAQMHDPDLFAVPFYLVLENRYEQAIEHFETLGSEPELVQLLRDPALHKQVPAYLRANLTDEVKREVKRIKENIRNHNAMTPQQWLRSALGELQGGVNNVKRSRQVDHLVTYTFTASCLDLIMFDAMAQAYPALNILLVAFDGAAGKQSYVRVVREEGKSHFTCETQTLEGGQTTWLEQLPPQLC